MPEESNSKVLRRWFTVSAVIILLLAAWLILRPMVLPIAWAAILAFLMSPLQMKLTRRFKGRRTLAASILTGLTPVAIFVPLVLLSIAFLRQVATLTGHLQQDPELFNLSSWLDPAQHPRIAGLAAWMDARLGIQAACRTQASGALDSDPCRQPVPRSRLS